MCTHLCCRVRLKWEDMPLGASFFEDVPSCGVYVFCIYSRARWSYRGRLRSLLLCPLSVERYYFPSFVDFGRVFRCCLHSCAWRQQSLLVHGSLLLHSGLPTSDYGSVRTTVHLHMHDCIKNIKCLQPFRRLHGDLMMKRINLHIVDDNFLGPTTTTTSFCVDAVVLC